MNDGRTRRSLLGTLGIAGGIALAGCTSGTERESAGTDPGTGGAGTDGSTDGGSDDTDAGTGTSADSGPYTAAMEPVGEVEFESPPETWVGGLGFSADVLTALGHADGAVGMADPRFWYTGFYDQLPGVSVPNPADLETVTTSDRNTRVELLYDLEADVFVEDPNALISIYGLEQSEATRLHEEVTPFFGNGSRRKRWSGWTYWPDGEDYRYYSIPEFVTKYGEAFREQERASAMRSYYESVMADVGGRVPSESDRPTLALVNGRYSPENGDGFIVYDPTSEIETTHGKKQYRDLNVVDAFEGQYGGASYVTVGYEGMLEQDPDVVVFHFGVTYSDFGGQNAVEAVADALRDNSVTAEVSAVQDDRLHVGGTPYQGPIVNLFQTEMTAQQLYPDEFGEFAGLGETPENPLFDRQRVADIVNGEV